MLQKKVHRNTHNLLRMLVSEHHVLFQTVFQKQLTPKLHFMIHYADIMEKIGPICFLSSMRFESFHRIFKNIIKNLNCRRNILKSCFFKIRMRHASFFLKFNSIGNSSILTGKKIKVPSCVLLQKYSCAVPLKEFVFTTSFVRTNAIMLKEGFVIHYENEDDESPIFVVIDKIILNENQVLFGYQVLSNLGFDDHYNAYKVERDEHFFIKPANFDVKPTYIFQAVANKQLVNWD